MGSPPTTVEQYLSGLGADRREAISAVRERLRAVLPAGLRERVGQDMIVYEVPLSRSGPTYNGQPMMFAGLASRQHHMALYLIPIYMDEEARAEFEAAWRATGKRLDAARSCVRFRSVEDLPMEVVEGAVRRHSLDEFVARVQAITGGRSRRGGAKAGGRGRARRKR